MPNSTSTIGFTANTLKHLMIDAGAIYKNYGLTNEALISATSGGNEFDITPKLRAIKADGLKSSFKGGNTITSIDVILKVNMLEITTDILKMALMADVDSVTDPDYDIITGRTAILDTDYIDNIALVGKVSGSQKPIIIILKNALAQDGIKLSNKDASDNILPITFTANIDTNDIGASVYEIRYPKISGSSFSVKGVPIIDNSKVLLTLNDTVDPVTPLDGFVVTVDAIADVVTACTRGINNLDTIALTLTTPPTSGQVVTVAYTKPALAANDIVSLSSVVLDTFAAKPVTNN